jgi:hypothetical protein
VTSTAVRLWVRLVDRLYVAGSWRSALLLALLVAVANAAVAAQSRPVAHTVNGFIAQLVVFGGLLVWSAKTSREATDALTPAERRQVADAARSGTCPDDPRLARALMELARTGPKSDNPSSPAGRRLPDTFWRGLGFALVAGYLVLGTVGLWNSAAAGHWIEVTSIFTLMAAAVWVSMVMLNRSVRAERQQQLAQAVTAAAEVLARAGDGPTAADAPVGP